jgi:hypothetical protein
MLNGAGDLSAQNVRATGAPGIGRSQGALQIPDGSILIGDEVVWPNFRFGSTPGALFLDGRFPVNAVDELASQRNSRYQKQPLVVPRSRPAQAQPDGLESPSNTDLLPERASWRWDSVSARTCPASSATGCSSALAGGDRPRAERRV